MTILFVRVMGVFHISRYRPLLPTLLTSVLLMICVSSTLSVSYTHLDVYKRQQIAGRGIAFQLDRQPVASGHVDGFARIIRFCRNRVSGQGRRFDDRDVEVKRLPLLHI